MLTSIQPRGCKPELPANTVWKKNSAPVERLTLIEQDIVQLESHALKAVRRESLTRDEQAKLMKEFSKVEREIGQSRPLVPAQKQGDKLKPEYPFTRNWNKATHQLIEVYQEVNDSLHTPGNSFEQTHGIIFKHTADATILKEFTNLRKEWGELTNRASRLKEKGFCGKG